MAELLLEVQPQPAGNGYDDGDCLCAFSDHEIQDVHAQGICWPRDGTGRKPIDEHGFRLDPDGLVAAYCNRAYGYRMERISPTEVRRVNLLTLGDEIVSPGNPSSDGFFINDVQGMVGRILAHNTAPGQTTGKIVLGTLGAEVWWQGSRNMTAADLDAVWNDIETATPKRRVDHRLWPWTPRERRRFLALSVDDFTPAEREDLWQPEGREISFVQTITTVTDLANDFRYRVDFTVNPVQWRPRVKVGDLLWDSAGLRCRVMEVFNNRLRIRSRQGVPSTGLCQITGTRHPRKRRRFLNWRALGLNNTDIDDRAVDVDVRDFANPWSRATHVQTKPLATDEEL